jgi:hypothetical protein
MRAWLREREVVLLLSARLASGVELLNRNSEAILI